MIDLTGAQRSSSQIKRSLELRRAELRDDMDLLVRGRKSRPGGSAQLPPMGAEPQEAHLPLLPIVAAGAIAGFLLMRRSSWPLRAAGRLIELAAPAMVPALARRFLGRD
jgi:hypothetical protein